MPRSFKIIMYSLAAVTAILIVSTWLSVSCSEDKDWSDDVKKVSSNVDRSKKWTVQFGRMGYEAGDQLIINKNNEIYLLGTTNDNLDGHHSEESSYDILLVKFNAKGEQIFLHQYGTSAVDAAFRMVMDDSENFYIAGGTDGSMDGIADAGGDKNRDIFFMKVDREGDVLWTKQFDVDGAQEIQDLVIYNNSYIYSLAYTNSDFNGEKHIGKNDLLVLKTDMDGNLVWSKILANGVFNKPMRIGIMNNDQILLAWYSVGDMPETPMQVESRIDEDIYLMALDSDGNKLWYNKYGTNFDDSFGDIAIDKEHIYIAGRTTGIFGQPEKENPNWIDILLLKLDLQGNLVWHKQLGNSDADSASAVFIDDDFVYLAGSVTGLLPNSISDNIYQGLSIIKLNKDGDILWSQKKLPYATSPIIPEQPYLISGIRAKDIVIDSDKNIFITGRTSGFLDHNKSTISEDVYILKYTNDGDQQ